MPTALYRRYRPDTFAEVIGQEHVTGPLRAALERGRVNHAYLFSGPRGCGKTTSARILARCLNCAKGPTPTPCGECESCVDLATGGPGSLDVVEIDAASHNGVDDARDLRERAVYAPARDRFKIFILDEAHMVTPQGFNALLKLVEEPPEHVKFVFATTEPEKVIGTIRSRTHHYPFRLVPPEIMTSYLAELCHREDVPVGKGVLPLVVRAGGGSVRDSLSVLDQLMAGSLETGLDYATAVALLGYTPEALLSDVIDAFSAGDGAAVFRVIDRVIESGQDPRRFVEDLLERFRDLIVVGSAPQQAAALLPDAPEDLRDALVQQAQTIGSAELSRAADLVNTGLSEMTGATSPRLQLELLCARILLPSVDDTRRGLLSRLDRMERRVGMSAAGAVNPGVAQQIVANDPSSTAGSGAGNTAASDSDGNTGSKPAAGRPESSGAGGSAGAGSAPGANGGTAGGSAGSSQGSHDSPQDSDDYLAAVAQAQSLLSDTSDIPQPSSSSPQVAAQNDQGSRTQATRSHSQAGRPDSPRDDGDTHARGDAGVSAESRTQRGTTSPAAADRHPYDAEPSDHRGQAAERQGATPGRSSDGPVQAHRAPEKSSPGSASATAPEQSADAAPSHDVAVHAEAQSPAAAPAASGNEIDTIRREWQNVLEALATRSKLARAIVSSNAVPQEFSNGALVLGFNNEGSAASFDRGSHAAKLADALDEVLGIRATVRIGEVGVNVESQPSAAAQPTPHRRPSEQEVASVVGTLAQDREVSDPDRYWQAPPESGPFSDNSGDDDAEAELHDASPASHESDAWQESNTWQEPGETFAPTDPAVGHDRFGTSSAHGVAEVPSDDAAPYANSVASDGDAVPHADLTAPPGEREPVADTVATPAAAPAPPADWVAPPVDTASGWGAVDMPSVVVPPPADIDDVDFGDDAGEADERHDGDETSERYWSNSPFESHDGDGLPDDGGALNANGSASAAASGFGDSEGGGEASSAQHWDPAAAPSVDAVTARPQVAPRDDLDFLGAYASESIMFTENEGIPTRAVVQTPARSNVADQIAARHARSDSDAQSEPSVNHPLPAKAPPPPDPAENYVDYITDDDPELTDAPEFGVPVVERLLGGEVLEEFRE